MKFYSTRKKEHNIKLDQAIVRGLASDGGLYMPQYLPKFSEQDISKFMHMDLPGMAFSVAKPLLDGAIEDNLLKDVIEETLNFPIPLVRVEEEIYSLELFHGPTMAFKDVGARFMARILPHLFKGEELNVVVATSGDTGAAVAQGFLGVKGVKVWVLYPKGKVSDQQEAQFTTMGENITALAVDGTFDHCQKMVKEILSDVALNSKISITSANSINVARFLPQMLYYFWAWSQYPKEHGDPIFSVPCGNFGNLAAGLMAQRMGLPIPHFVVATNSNDVVPQYLLSGIFEPRKSVRTVANAMDVGNPSNFERIAHLYNDNVEDMRENISAFSFSDPQILSLIEKVNKESGYLMDPHGATAYGALKNYQMTNKKGGVFLETAHPAKFKEIIDPIIKKSLELPPQLSHSISKKRISTEIPASTEALKDLLLSSKK